MTFNLWEKKVKLREKIKVNSKVRKRLGRKSESREESLQQNGEMMDDVNEEIKF